MKTAAAPTSAKTATSERCLGVGDVMNLVPVNEGETADVRYRITTCSEPNLNVKPPEICFHSPLAAPFIGQEVGHEALVPRKNKRIKMRLASIEGPEGIPQI